MRSRAALWLLLFCPAIAAARPMIDPAGVVNAASLLPPGLPGGNLAPGALFLVQGRLLGPSTAATSEVPVEELAGVSVRIQVARNSWNALLLEAGDKQIRALVPIEIGLGPATVTVTVDGQQSPAAYTRVVAASPGLFTLAGNGVGPARLLPVRRGETVAMLATGLGVTRKSRIEVFVGGRAAKEVQASRDKECCGVERVTFVVPSDAPADCYVPVQLRAGGSITSNIATLAIDPPPSCTATDYLRTTDGSSGRLGFAIPFRLSILLDNDPAPQNHSAGDPARNNSTNRPGENKNIFIGDALAAGFRAGTPGPGADRMLYPPALGACTLYTAGGSLPEADRYIHDTLLADTTPLNGGLFAVALPEGGSRTIPHLPEAGDYEYGKLGGEMPPVNGSFVATQPFAADDTPEGIPSPNDPSAATEQDADAKKLFLQPGPITISTQGGPDVPAFKIKTEFPKPIVWTNRDQIEVVRRSEDLEVHWEMENPEQTVAIAGLSIDKPGHASAAFLCLVSGSERSFQVPAPILQSLPATRTGPQDSQGYLILGALPPQPNYLQTTPGLDYILAIGIALDGRTAKFR